MPYIEETMPVDVDVDNQVVRARRALRRSGDSVVLTIPPDILQQAGMEEGDEIVLSVPFNTDEIRLTKADDQPEAPPQN